MATFFFSSHARAHIARCVAGDAAREDETASVLLPFAAFGEGD